MECVERVEQGLTDDLEEAKLHYFGFVVRESRKFMVELRPDVYLETRAISLSRPQLESRHVHSALEPVNPSRRVDIETLRPDRIRLTSQRRNQGREKLI